MPTRTSTRTYGATTVTDFSVPDHAPGEAGLQFRARVRQPRSGAFAYRTVHLSGLQGRTGSTCPVRSVEASNDRRKFDRCLSLCRPPQVWVNSCSASFFAFEHRPMIFVESPCEYDARQLVPGSCKGLVALAARASWSHFRKLYQAEEGGQAGTLSKVILRMIRESICLDEKCVSLHCTWHCDASQVQSDHWATALHAAAICACWREIRFCAATAAVLWISEPWRWTLHVSISADRPSWELVALTFGYHTNAMQCMRAQVDWALQMQLASLDGELYVC